MAYGDNVLEDQKLMEVLGNVDGIEPSFKVEWYTLATQRRLKPHYSCRANRFGPDNLLS
jgi:hypothetical protein